MPNLVNRLLTKEYSDAFGKARGMVILNVSGMTVIQGELFRDLLAEKGVKMRMVRNSLARRVLAERGFEIADATFSGSVAICYGNAEAAIHAAKILTKPEIKKTVKAVVKGGVLEDTLLNAKDTLALADVPDQQTLRAQIVGAIQGPSRMLATLLAATPSGLARVIQAKNDKQGGEPATAAAPQA